MLVIVAVLIVAALAGVAYYLLSTGAPPVTPPAVTLGEVTISGGNTMDQAALLTLTATATDTEGQSQTANATWTWSASPAAAVDIRDTLQESSKQVFAIQAGTVTITANASWNNSARESTHSVTVSALSFDVTPSDIVPLVGQAFSLTVRVLRGTATASGYTGTVTFESTDAGATLPADYTFSLADGGLRSFSGVKVSQPGAVTFTVSDTLADITGSVTVSGNQLPDVSFTLTPNPANPLEVTADGSASSDPDGDAITFDWDFGDGGSAMTAVATHTYAAAGTYTIRLTVTDIHADSNFSEQTYVAMAPPTASFRIVSVTPSGLGVQVSVDASASSDPDGSIVNYNWTWGDGTYSDTPGPVTTHDYDATLVDQTVTIVLVVTDDDGLTDSASQTVQLTVLPLPPTASFVITDVDQDTRTVMVDGSASSDPNANIMWYNWTWGDGSYTNTTNPMASHQYGADGDFVITLTVVDTTNLKDSAEQTVTISQPDQPPLASFTVDRSFLHVDVDASSSSDPNGNIATYEWDFDDDGTIDDTGVQASYDYATPGKYTISLLVTDTTALQGSTTRTVSVARSTLDYRYYDFFNVPYGEWWDYRTSIGGYGDLPIDAECFSAEGVANGICSPTDPNVDDIPSYPYTNWYPLPGAIQPGNPNNNPLIYTPYRFDAIGANVSGYSLSEPVFLPVFDYGEAPGQQADFRWEMGYPGTAALNALEGEGCPVSQGDQDGFVILSRIWITLDLQQSRRIFGVVAADAGEAQTWWDTNTDSACNTELGVEASISAWFELLGGTQLAAGKYDIYNSYEYWYQPIYTNVTAVVDPTTGLTDVYVEHVAFGTEVLLARMFYWGNASYMDSYLDSTAAEGWWGMELAWFEDFVFQGGLGKTTFNFTLNSVMQYHFQQLSLPGSDGNWDRVGDIPYWTWGPLLSDYTDLTDNTAQAHHRSELDRYPSPAYGYIHTTPGSAQYSENLSYDYAPIRWDLSTGQTWRFEFPAGDVVFYDPNNTPIGADPSAGEYVSTMGPLAYESTKPADYGVWDASSLTWEVFGPAVTGGPDGSPGNYALEPWGAISLVEGASGAMSLAEASLASSESSTLGPSPPGDARMSTTSTVASAAIPSRPRRE